MSNYIKDEEIQNNQIKETISILCEEESYKNVIHGPHNNIAMPSVESLKEIVDLLREVIFPGYFGNSCVQLETMQYYIGVSIDKIFNMLSEQIKRGFCFDICDDSNKQCLDCEKNAKRVTSKFISALPLIRYLMSTDVKASYNGDPAAKSFGEVIFCYPGIRAITNYRIAHELLKLNVPLIPRIITEMAHSETGIDIHPGAKIGEYFAIDHGTGTVIGETCIIGNNVKLYQGVTLGAKSFPLDESGNPIKGINRHPIIEDNVVIYSEATILGRIRIGKDSIIGANIWVTHDVPPGSTLTQSKKN
ncbi:MAG: serine O-acetyltransferase EpsC [Bacteroidota bacterium]|nr:serine O-acetyltransferase EpsC [Bacteroidota bacterium]